MANKLAASKLHFGTDLIKQALHHIAFLKAIDIVPDLKNPAVLKQAVYRYEKYWLPLAANHLKECLVAPLEIEWVWHCHMLFQTAYEKDCQAVVGTTVNHRLYDGRQFEERLKQSRKYWLEKYGDHEPFDVASTSSRDVDTAENCRTKISYDIVAAAQRQMVFYYQVSLPHYRDKKYLKKSLLRYKQFLYLKTNLPKTFLVPCYDIDLIWHTHQLNPVVYKEDMMRIIGRLFNHDDTDSDRSVGSKLYNANKETRERWKNFYNETFSLFGAMYRGNPPTGILYKITPEEAHLFGANITDVTFEKLLLTRPAADRDRVEKIKLTVSSAVSRTIADKWFSLKGAVLPGECTVTWTSNIHHTLDTGRANMINILLQEYIDVNWTVCRSKHNIGSICLRFPKLESGAYEGNAGKFNAKVPIGTNFLLDVQGRLAPLRKGKAILVLEAGKYETAVIPENVQQLWGPVALERLRPGTDNHCQVASHRLKYHVGNVEFTARTIHSQTLMMSVIQVFYRDKMSAIGHLVASDQLPLPTQVSNFSQLFSDWVLTKDEISLSPRQGERAILIKNNEGDWGIITGRWKGFKRGVAGTDRRRGVPGSPGTLFLKFHKFSIGSTTTAELGYHRKVYTFSMQSAVVDLMKGVLRIDPTSNEVAENYLNVFCFSVTRALRSKA